MTKDARPAEPPPAGRPSPTARLIKSAQAAEARHQRARNAPLLPGQSESVVRGFKKSAQAAEARHQRARNAPLPPGQSESVVLDSSEGQPRIERHNSRPPRTRELPEVRTPNVRIKATEVRMIERIQQVNKSPRICSRYRLLMWKFFAKPRSRFQNPGSRSAFRPRLPGRIGAPLAVTCGTSANAAQFR